MCVHIVSARPVVASEVLYICALQTWHCRATWVQLSHIVCITLMCQPSCLLSIACFCFPIAIVCDPKSNCVLSGGDVKKLDFRFFVGNNKIGAPFHGLKAFFTTGQLNVLDKVSQPDQVPWLHESLPLHARAPTPSCIITRAWASDTSPRRLPFMRTLMLLALCLIAFVLG